MVLLLIVISFRIERRSFSGKEPEQFTHYCRVVVQDFLPYLVNCFNALFPPQTVNELASCSPYVLQLNSTTLSNQQPALHTTGRRGIQFKLEFDLQKLIKPLKVMLPDLFANDLYIADSLTQHQPLLHNDEITGSVGPVGDKKSDTIHNDEDDDVILNSVGETPVINGDQHDHTSQGELAGTSNKEMVDTTKELMTDKDLPVISTGQQQNTTVI